MVLQMIPGVSVDDLFDLLPIKLKVRIDGYTVIKVIHTTQPHE